MQWTAPLPAALLAVPLLGVLWLLHRHTVHPMHLRRRRLLTAIRSALVVLALLALAGPAWEMTTGKEAIIFLLDHSRSQGREGMEKALQRTRSLLAGHDETGVRPRVGFVSVGTEPHLLRRPGRSRDPLRPDFTLLEEGGAQTDLAAGVSFASGLFPPGAVRRLVVVGDGMETKGDLERAAREAAASGVIIDALPVAGPKRPDVRVVRLRSSRSRLHEGASLDLHADLESSIPAQGTVRLFENGIQVASRSVQLQAGEERTVTFRRTPEEPNLYKYRVRAEGFPEDAIPENDEALALVDVRGRPVLLYVEGEPEEAHYLVEAMEEEGLRLHRRPPEALPESPRELMPYDALIISNVAAHRLSEAAMSAIRNYVEKLGGGFLMIGGKDSFGVGGYYRTPIEEILPVKMVPPDLQEKHVVAVALVMDRSGSMQGEKIEICKSAAIGTLDLLGPGDYVGVVAFDSRARWVAPLAQVGSGAAIRSQISTLGAGGGTNIYPGMSTAFQGLQEVRARAKHMIVLSDGQTQGEGYRDLAATIRESGITVSTVAVGPRADAALLRSIAGASGGKFYQTYDPSAIPRIFTQDTMIHTARLIREETFKPRQVERHPMLRGWPAEQAPPLLGYIKTDPRATAQVPLVSERGEPLLAHWRFGLGKVSAFTSDCTSRWSSLWLTGWQEGYNQFWAQVMRETARQPQGQFLDVRLTRRGNSARIRVDALQDPARFKNRARVGADVYFLPPGAVGTGMEPVSRQELQQEGPGLYAGEFPLDEPGVYLVRARCGGEMVSAGLVHNPSGETAGGRINMPLLRRITSLSGGEVLGPDATRLPSTELRPTRTVELTPYLLKLLVLLFLVDLCVRRWENVLGVGEWAGGLWRRLSRATGSLL